MQSPFCSSPHLLLSAHPCNVSFRISTQFPLHHTPQSPPTRRVSPSASRSSPLHLRAIRICSAPMLHRHRAAPDQGPARTVWRRRLHVNVPCRVRRPLDACRTLVAGGVRVYDNFAVQAMLGRRRRIVETLWRCVDGVFPDSGVALSGALRPVAFVCV